MPHQAQVVAAAAAGPPHLPARRRARPRQDRPGAARRPGRQRLPAARRRPQRRQDQLGPRGRALDAATARPPSSTATATTIDGFADIVVVNYEVLDRHVGWLGDLGFRGMVVDEAHFIKNKTSQRSQHVLAALRADPGRASRRPLLMALTGTPLINDIEDFRAIWQFLGWIDDKKPLRRADGRARGDRADAGRPRLLPPPPATRVIDMGIVRRRKVDVAADIPARRIADLPGRARRRGRPLDPRGRARARPPPGRALRQRAGDPHAPARVVEGIDHELVRRVATWEREDTTTTKSERERLHA